MLKLNFRKKKFNYRYVSQIACRAIFSSKSYTGSDDAYQIIQLAYRQRVNNYGRSVSNVSQPALDQQTQSQNTRLSSINHAFPQQSEAVFVAVRESN